MVTIKQPCFQKGGYQVWLEEISQLENHSVNSKLEIAKTCTLVCNLWTGKIVRMACCQTPRHRGSFHCTLVIELYSKVNSICMTKKKIKQIFTSSPTKKRDSFSFPEPTFLLVSTKNTDSGHSQRRESANHRLPALLCTLRNLKQ